MALDARFGELPAPLHPVVWMGRYLGLKGALLRPTDPPVRQLTLGAGFVLTGALGCWAAAWALGRASRRLPPLEGLALAPLLKPLFSLEALLQAGAEVEEALEAGDLTEARRRLAWHLVSRDTRDLSEAEVAGAAVASLAENLTDSVVAPLFYFAFLGLPGAALYRFVNTADAVLGYRTPELEYFGKPAARADDVLSHLPARLAAGLLALALGPSARTGTAWQAMRRERRRTPSPNSGWTMALTAAGLGVRLEKRGVYVLNDPGRAATGADIGRARRLVRRSALLGLGLYALLCLSVHRTRPHA